MGAKPGSIDLIDALNWSDGDITGSWATRNQYMRML